MTWADQLTDLSDSFLEDANVLLVFDADNTLWDTNAVFLEAQEFLIHELRRRQIDPGADPIRRLRQIDQQLIAHFGQAEYDFRYLWRALVQGGVLAGQGIENLPPASEEDPIAEQFLELLRCTPPLLPTVTETFARLQGLRNSHWIIGIFSEGDEERIRTVLHAYRELEKAIDFVVIGKKDVGGYENLLQAVDLQRTKAYMVGDSLQRDILNSKVAGFTTIYVESDYVEQNRGKSSDLADYRIHQLMEVVGIVA